MFITINLHRRSAFLLYMSTCFNICYSKNNSAHKFIALMKSSHGTSCYNNLETCVIKWMENKIKQHCNRTRKKINYKTHLHRYKYFHRTNRQANILCKTKSNLILFIYILCNIVYVFTSHNIKIDVIQFSWF